MNFTEGVERMNKNQYLRSIPSIDVLLLHERVQKLINHTSKDLVLYILRELIEEYRKSVLNESFEGPKPMSNEDFINLLERRSNHFTGQNLKRVINATGVVLHTNLGRAVFGENMKEKFWEVLSNYSNLELNLDTGKRGSRYEPLVEKIKYLTKGEDALVVNNNAAAVMLVLSSVAKDKEVIVSRGELVEIGGAFRIPDVMEQSGAKLVEVGTTNKTNERDYESKINEETGALLKVHTSNYKILGFTQDVSLETLVNLGKENHVPVIEDLGSGVLLDLEKYGLSHEPTVQESVAAGTDIVTFSGDKLLGGPQAGIIVGKKEWIDKMKKNPLTRAFRIDKMTVAALDIVFSYYVQDNHIEESIPSLKALSMNYGDLQKKAQKLKSVLDRIGNEEMVIHTRKDESQVGGGSLPLERMQTEVVVIEFIKSSVARVEEGLRKLEVPIIARIKDKSLLLDVRTIKEEDFLLIMENFTQVLEKHGNG